MDSHYILYSAEGSGGVAVEAALTLMGAPYRLVEAMTFEAGDPSGDAVLAANPMRQVPALVLPGGEVMTESAAILIRLAELGDMIPIPDTRRGRPAGSREGIGIVSPLAPDDPRRAQFLRWMSFVSSAIYAFYWQKDDPFRLVADPAAHPAYDAAIQDRISDCWAIMEAGLSPGRYLLGDDLTVLDLYVAVVSRFRPRRQRFYAAAPRMGDVVRRVDADPRLQALWAARYPFTPGWDRL